MYKYQVNKNYVSHNILVYITM